MTGALGEVGYAQELVFQPSSPPDYANEANWAALPFKKDAADGTPKGVSQLSDSDKLADVFFIHPTTYRKGNNWNADVQDRAVNKVVDEKPIKYQASAWNGVCRVFAPRYRQANLKAFFTNQPEGEKALDLAYSDVRRAFQYYLEHYNHGRPIVIASHSQGSKHARRLLAEFFDTTSLRKQLVCAYVVGWPVNMSNYSHLEAATTPDATGGVVGWATFRDGFVPEGLPTFYHQALCINPVSWRADTTATPAAASKGMVLFKFRHLLPGRVAARRYETVLWADIRHPLAKRFNNLHVGDINLFWMDIRENVALRVKTFLQQRAAQ